MILIADAHITEERQNRFFKMLDDISKTREDVIFVGDIFDIWIPFSKYELNYHRKFLQWCRKEKEQRKVIFLEGNHEFHIQDTYMQNFTEVTSRWLMTPDTLVLHGENTLQAPWSITRIILAVLRSKLGKLLFQFTPGGATIAKSFRKILGHNPHVKFIPPKEKICKSLYRYCEKSTIKNVVVGHFHTFRQWTLPKNGICLILPAWYQKGEIVHYSTKKQKFITEKWQTIRTKLMR